MRPLKAALAGLLFLAIGAIWTNRGLVVDAYRTDGPAPSLHLSGVDLAYEPSRIDGTPYRVPSAPDTRAAPQSVAFQTDAAIPLPATSLTGGEAELGGIVTGPDGPVPGAVVRIERHTMHGAISVDVSTDEEGRWAMAPLAGGRYRVRAWLPDQLTMGRSEVRFVADDEKASFDFSLWGVDPAPAFEFVDGGPMYEGLPATVAVVLAWRSVDADGLVVINALPGAEVTVETTAQIEVLGGQPLITGGDGVARIRLRCLPTSVAPLADGSGGSLTARSGEISASFAMPGCLPIPEPDPELEPDPDREPDPDPDPELEPEQSDG